VTADVGGLPVYFGRSFGFLHRPEPSAARSRGVVLCSPDGYETLCVYRPWQRFAREIAAAGLPVLRFDYPGCGDAPEADEDPERVRAWLDGIRDAVAFLREQTGVTEVALVGLRFGALLAAVAAQEMAAKGEPIDTVTLLAPPVSGEAFYKELRVLAMMARTKPAPGTAEPKSLQAAGFYYTPCTLGAIRALAPAQAATPPAPRVLIMDRADGGGAALAEAFRSKGAAVETLAFAGYSVLMRDAAVSDYPEADLSRVVDWLRQGAPQAVAPAPLRATRETTAIPGGRESAVFTAETGLFGILSEPETPAGGGAAFLMLNTGANHHIGTNRLSVMIARRLVRQGVTVLRVDLRGLGESPSAPDRPDRTIFDARLVPEVRDAVDFLAARGHREIVANGLCAGAWLAYHATLVEPRITGQLLLNIQNLWMKGSLAREAPSNREYLRKFRSKETWLRLVRGDVKAHIVIATLATRIAEAVAIRLHRAVTRARGAETLVEKTRRMLDAVAARGTRTAFFFNREDEGLDEMEVHFGREGRALADVPGVNIMIIDDGDHIFSIKSSRDRLLELMAAQFTDGRFVPTVTQISPAPRATATLQSQTA
jgi:pimeloyl-ACP methyl ester carboxylesterase